MKFNIDKTHVTEGDVVEVMWQGDGAEEINLTIDNGFKVTTISLPETTGSKKFRLNRSKGKTKLILSWSLSGKKHVQCIKVKVSKIPTVKTETIYENGKTGPKAYVQHQLQHFRQRFGEFWQQLSQPKQMAYKILGLMFIGLVMAAIWPRLYSLSMLLVLAYLGWVIVKR